MDTYFIFGSTGNLAQTKIIKALFQLHKEGDKNFRVYCIGRRDMTDLEFRDFTSKNLDQGEDTLSFLKNIYYLKINVEDRDSFWAISQILNTNISRKIFFYLALPPKEYLKVLDGLSFCNLDKENFILLEKPFAPNSYELLKINDFSQKFLQKSKILYVDHYLFKNLISDIWDFKKERKDFYENILKIEVYFLESNDISQRGSFYDGVGVVYDVFQNHILEMISSVFSLEKSDRVSVLKSLIVSTDDMKRGQYKGFIDHSGVEKDSKTETYLNLKLLFRAIEIFVEAGKSCQKQNVSVTVYFKNDQKIIFNSSGENAYIKLFKNLRDGLFENFVSFDEAFILFKISDEVKSLVSKLPLEIYDLENGLC